jgi:hypothetical protein
MSLIDEQFIHNIFSLLKEQKQIRAYVELKINGLAFTIFKRYKINEKFISFVELNNAKYPMSVINTLLTDMTKELENG